MKDRIRILFLPFIIALLGLLIGYTFFNWLLLIELQWVSIKEIIVEFVVPVTLTGIVTWFIIRPKLKILNLKSKKGSYSDFYCFVLWIGLTIPLIIAQNYIASATGKKAILNSVKEIGDYPKAKYFNFDTYFIHDKGFSYNPTFEVTGRHNENFNMSIHVVFPIYEKAQDTLGERPLAWYGIRFFQKISNRLDRSEKNDRAIIFERKTLNKIRKPNNFEFNYLERVGNNDDRHKYILALERNSIYKKGDTILIGQTEAYGNRNGNKLAALIWSSLICSFMWFIMIMIPKIDERELKRIKAGKPDKRALRARADFIDFMTPNQNYFFTPILIYINLFVFIIMVVLGLGFVTFDTKALLSWGANYGPYVAEGQYWRLLSSIFLHGGFIHLAVNMVSLLFASVFLEPLMGRKKFIVLYLLTGLVASLSSIWWNDPTVSVGASGAIFGLYGFFVATLLFRPFDPSVNKGLLVTILFFVGFNLIVGLTDGIDNASHIGGLLSGFVLGILYYLFVMKKYNKD